MKSFRLTVAALAAAGLAVTVGHTTSVAAQDASTSPSGTRAVLQLAQASPFGMQETDQSRFILSTNPTSSLGGRQRYGLMILEQKAQQPPCFSTVGSNPTVVLPLLAQLPDFSGICGRSTDTNGYLIRAAGEDIKYDPVLEEENGVLVLYAKPTPFAGSSAQKFVMGQTDGISPSGYTQIFLKPGWRLARQTLANGSLTGRTYLANDLTTAQLIQQDGGTVIVQPPTTTPPTTPPVTPPAPAAGFPDVQGDTYANEINRAVQLGFISGFKEDNTFRPTAPLTREQVVSIVVEGLGQAPAAGAATASPYPDVPAGRWSATKIERAKSLGLISGYPNGTFRPTQAVTRAELIAIMNKAAQYKNQVTALTPNQTGLNFSDTSGHWAQSTISSLSSYCGIATPLNETGSSFFPNQSALRNYAAAAMVRLLDCSQTNPPAQ
ncbi:MAG: DUF3747 domain-containing protein [Phormidesmis sp.]